MEPPRSCIVIQALLLLLCSHLGVALRCSLSGYCSKGKLKPYFGDIHSSEGFKAALSARAYKQEVIVVVVTAHRLLPALQLVDNLDKLGIEHVMLVSSDEGACGEVAAHVPHIGCVWDSFKLPMEGRDIGVVTGMAPLWHTRYRVMARAVRLRHNPLVMDSDVVLFDDPYRYFKAPPFRDFTILNQPEVLYDQGAYAQNVKPNGGVIYVQNADPAGPAAWLTAETVDRPLRWIEDRFNTSMAGGLYTWCCYLDQDCLNEVLPSALEGRLSFVGDLATCAFPPWRQAHKELADAIGSEHRRILDAAWKYERDVPLPHWMWPVAGGNTTNLRWAPIKLPNVQGPWRQEVGGGLYPPRRGELSLRLQAQLREDCGGCPLWPDPEDARQAGAASAVQAEKYLYMPPWLALGWFPRGRLGYWAEGYVGTPQQVIGHAHYIPETDASVGKVVMRMAVGQYDWQLAERLARGKGVYWANRDTPGASDPANRSRAEGGLPRLLALHPRVRLDRLAGYDELHALLRGLQQLAALSKRAVLWPDLPCDLPFISRPGTPVPQWPGAEWFPVRSAGHGAGGMHCVFRQLLKENCLTNGRGMLQLEFRQHFRLRWGVRFDLEPHAGNIAFLTEAGQLHGALSPGAQVLGVAVLGEEEAAGHLAAYEDARLLYVGHPVSLRLDDAGRQRQARVWYGCVDDAKMADLHTREGGRTSRLVHYQGSIKGGRLHIGEKLPSPPAPPAAKAGRRRWLGSQPVQDSVQDSESGPTCSIDRASGRYMLGGMRRQWDAQCRVPGQD